MPPFSKSDSRLHSSCLHLNFLTKIPTYKVVVLFVMATWQPLSLATFPRVWCQIFNILWPDGYRIQWRICLIWYWLEINSQIWCLRTENHQWNYELDHWMSTFWYEDKFDFFKYLVSLYINFLTCKTLNREIGIYNII